ncbi:hypothetical protein FO519_003237 [Halicephalobus sp. NKZ332]|nr:hypothetical protein FO519_003237 [Halicephalobus sp. NKZ332]
MDSGEKEEGERSSDEEIETLEIHDELVSQKNPTYKQREGDEMSSSISSMEFERQRFPEVPFGHIHNPKDQMRNPSTKVPKNRRKRNRVNKAPETTFLDSPARSIMKNQMEHVRPRFSSPFFGSGSTNFEPTKTGANRLPLGGPSRFGVRPPAGPYIRDIHVPQYPEPCLGFMNYGATPNLTDSFRNHQGFFNVDLPIEEINQGRLGLENIPLDSRLSEDMDISPVDSVGPDPGPGYVIEVNSPLESEGFDELQSVGVVGQSNYFKSTAAHERRELPPEQNAGGPSGEVLPNSALLKRKKRFSKKFIDGIRSALLDSLEDSSSGSGSESELYEESQKLKNQLDYHRDELSDWLEKKTKLVKELENCELVINYHQESIARLMKDISVKSTQDLLVEMADMTVPVPMKNVRQTESKLEETSGRFLNKNNEIQPIEPDTSKETQKSASSTIEAGTSDLVNVPLGGSIFQQKQREDIIVSDIMLDDIERRRRKRQKLLSKEEELREKLMKKKSTMSVTKKTSISKDLTTGKSPIIEKLSGRTLGSFEKSPRIHLLPRRSASVASSSPKKSSSPSVTKLSNVPGTVGVEENSKEILPGSSNDENALSNNSDVIERTLENIRHCNSMNSLKSFILDETVPVKESLENFRCRIDPNTPICYFDIYGHCMDQNCNE